MISYFGTIVEQGKPYSDIVTCYHNTNFMLIYWAGTAVDYHTANKATLQACTCELWLSSEYPSFKTVLSQLTSYFSLISTQKMCITTYLLHYRIAG